MKLADAAVRFHRAIEHCDNLVEVHRRAGPQSPGRRYVETSVNRAVIVIAMACWQAVVQDFAVVLLDESMPSTTDPNRGIASLLAGRVRTEVGAFATPNAENTRKLLQSAGYDPRPAWTWKTGQFGRDTLQPSQVEDQLREWLKVRHAIAHGHVSMPSVTVLQAVAQNSSLQNDPPIRLYDAKRCLQFVRRLAQTTADGVAGHLGLSTELFAS